MRNVFLKCMLLMFIFNYCSDSNSQEMISEKLKNVMGEYEIATLAGGCFWCMEEPYSYIDGVIEVIPGYSGGRVANPTYEQVSSGNTGHREVVQIYFNPSIVSYTEILDIYWKQFDPTDDGGSFADRGSQYRSGIFYHSETQRLIAEKSKQILQDSGRFGKPVITEIILYTNFYPAEYKHRAFFKNNPDYYKKYKLASGREAFIKGVWNDKNLEKYKQNTINKNLKEQLTDIQYSVTQKNQTERSFHNEFWDNEEPGIYVDIVSGEPLFSSRDKFQCGSGWPSFSKPIDTRLLKKKSDNSYGMDRIEVRSKIADSHLGHVFYDGPEPTKLRYCINSASLRFIPKDKMAELGYGDYLWLLE